MKREKLLGSFRKAVPFGANKKSPPPPPPGKKPPWGVRGRIRVRLGIGLGLEPGGVFSRGIFSKNRSFHKALPKLKKKSKEKDQMIFLHMTFFVTHGG